MKVFHKIPVFFKRWLPSRCKLGAPWTSSLSYWKRRWVCRCGGLQKLHSHKNGLRGWAEVWLSHQQISGDGERQQQQQQQRQQKLKQQHSSAAAAVSTYISITQTELSHSTNTNREIQIQGTAADGVRLHLDHSLGPFTNLPQYQMPQYSDLSQLRQHSFGHDGSAANQRNGSVEYNWSGVTASAVV